MACMACIRDELVCDAIGCETADRLRKSLRDAMAKLREPDACGCEEVEALKKRIRSAQLELECSAPSVQLHYRVWKILADLP